MRTTKNLEKARRLRRNGSKAFRIWLLKRPALSSFLDGLLKRMDKRSGLYLVGGIVRDVIMGREGAHDIDIMASGEEYERMGEILGDMRRSRKYGLRDVVSAGKSFPVYKAFVKWNREPFDIALARTEISTGSGHRDFITSTETVTAREDSCRRDFTVNAMFLRIRRGPRGVTGNIIDYHGGLADLASGLIRAVGNPDDRFTEDPLRMMRAIRQKNQLGFSIEKGTWDSIRRLTPRLIKTISGERISTELMKSLGASPSGSMEDFHKSGLAETLVPEFAENPKLFSEAEKRMALIGRGASQTLLAACLLSETAIEESRQRLDGGQSHPGKKAKRNAAPDDPDFYSEETARAIMKRLFLPGQRQITAALHALTVFANLDRISFPYAVFEELLRDEQTRNDIVDLAEIYEKSRGITPRARMMARRLKETPPVVNGAVLAKAGVPCGPEMKTALRRARQAQFEPQEPAEKGWES